MTNRLFVAMLLSTSLGACERDVQEQTSEHYGCLVEWRGTLTTDSNAFNVQACWNGRCTGNIPVQALRNDAGLAVASVDAGCVPPTPGGPPSHCEFVPITPEPGCGVGEIGTDFSVSACAQSGRDGTTFGIVLTATREGYPDAGDSLGLTIETTTGNALVEATADVGNDVATASSRSCRGGLFDLDGTRIAG
jgi:hypothetical protein